MVYKAIPEAERGSGKRMRVRGQPGPRGEVNATLRTTEQGPVSESEFSPKPKVINFSVET